MCGLLPRPVLIRLALTTFGPSCLGRQVANNQFNGTNRLAAGWQEAIVSKRIDGTYRSGPCSVWIKVRNPASVAMQRERSEKWNR
jgi:hypothetical protein